MSEPKFAPVLERPVRTERAIRKRREAEKRESTHEALRRHVEQKKERQQ
jgi:hypothetical protein